MNNERMDRRNVLAAGGAGLAILAAPAWIQRAFAGQGADTSDPAQAPEPETLARALERATAIGKPLMVIVVPAEELRLERGRLWGDLFAFAPEAAMADFALCEWTCASATDLARARPDSQPSLMRDTAAVLIETGDARVKIRLVSFRLGDLPARKEGGFPTKEMQERAAEFAGLLQKAILPDADSLLARHTQCASSQAPGSTELPLLHEGAVRYRVRATDRHAATLRIQAEQLPPAERARCIASLAQAASLRLWDSEVAGASWRTEHSDPCPPCGMARMDGASRAFLEFYATTRR